jgi:hypothetical protein
MLVQHKEAYLVEEEKGFNSLDKRKKAASYTFESVYWTLYLVALCSGLVWVPQCHSF